MPLDRVQVIVEHLLNDGSRDGLILGDELNVAMGASARRRDPAAHHHEAWQIRESAKGGTYCAACGGTVTPPPMHAVVTATVPRRREAQVFERMKVHVFDTEDEAVGWAMEHPHYITEVVPVQVVPSTTTP